MNASTGRLIAIFDSPGCVGGDEEEQRVQAGIPERDAEAAPAAASSDAFGDELTHQASASGAERGAQRHLAARRAGAREQQVRYVRAGDQQQQSDCAEQPDSASRTRSRTTP